MGARLLLGARACSSCGCAACSERKNARVGFSRALACARANAHTCCQQASTCGARLQGAGCMREPPKTFASLSRLPSTSALPGRLSFSAALRRSSSSSPSTTLVSSLVVAKPNAKLNICVDRAPLHLAQHTGLLCFHPAMMVMRFRTPRVAGMGAGSREPVHARPVCMEWMVQGVRILKTTKTRGPRSCHLFCPCPLVRVCHLH